MVRKGGLEPPRYCYRQPLKLGDLLCSRGLTRLLRADVGQERAAANACDEQIRTQLARIPVDRVPPWAG